MLENIREKYRKLNKEADEKNVKSWQKHQRLNDWFVFIYSSIMIGGGIIVIALSLFGYAIQEIIISTTVLAICSAIVPFVLGIWMLRYRKRIIKRAFPN